MMGNSNAKSFWSGLAIGAAIVLLTLWLSGRNSAPQNTAKTKNDNKSSQKQEDIHFEFYRMLPELEVVLPENIEQQEVRPSLLENQQQKQPQQSSPQIRQIESLPGSYYLQTGSFSDRAEAEKMKARLSLLGFEVSVQHVNVNNKNYHRVRIGPFAQLDSLKEARQMLKSNHISFIAIKASKM